MSRETWIIILGVAIVVIYALLMGLAFWVDHLIPLNHSPSKPL